jgi:hypothetical protein
MVLIGDSINYIESIYGISSADIATRYIFLYIYRRHGTLDCQIYFHCQVTIKLLASR